MSSLFEESLELILDIEGDWSDHPSDLGGKTRFGITERVARDYGYAGPMKDLPVALAKQIYREKYWNVMKLSSIEAIAPNIVRELFDTGINQGVGRAGEYLQESLNALNRRQKDYADVIVDGDIGPQTLKALQAYIAHRGGAGEVVLLRALNCLQGARYISISQSREENEDFVFGWFQHRILV